jgi:hypothetical protein
MCRLFSLCRSRLGAGSGADAIMHDPCCRARAMQARASSAKARATALQAYAEGARERCRIIALETRKRIVLNGILLGRHAA